MIYSNYFIEGLSKDGEIIYSRTLSFTELSNLKFKIIITPTDINPYLPLEVENRTKYPIEVMINSTPMIISLEPGATIKRRPLPSDISTYTIEVIANTSSEHVTSFRTVFNKTFSRSELEKQGWKIVVTDSS